jgi:hypothetical protein
MAHGPHLDDEVRIERASQRGFRPGAYGAGIASRLEMLLPRMS